MPDGKNYSQWSTRWLKIRLIDNHPCPLIFSSRVLAAVHRVCFGCGRSLWLLGFQKMNDGYDWFNLILIDLHCGPVIFVEDGWRWWCLDDDERNDLSFILFPCPCPETGRDWNHCIDPLCCSAEEVIHLKSVQKFRWDPARSHGQAY